jgi:hypothetical protein
MKMHIQRASVSPLAVIYNMRDLDEVTKNANAFSYAIVRCRKYSVRNTSCHQKKKEIENETRVEMLLLAM